MKFLTLSFHWAMLSLTVITPELLELMIIFQPCLPGFMGGFYLSQNGQCTLQQFSILSTAINISQFWFILWFYDNAMIGSIYFVSLPLIALFVFCDKLTQNSWRSSLRRLSIYRELKVLEAHINGCLSSIFLPVFIASLSFLSITTIYVSIKSFHLLFKEPGLLFFPIVSMGVNTNYFAFSFVAGKSNLLTNNFIANCKTAARTRFNVRIVRSLSAVKVRFGSNFVEMITGLNFVNFCLNNVMALLLLN